MFEAAKSIGIVETYPVVGDPLVSLLDRVVSRLARDGEPALDDVVAELALGRLGTVVGHEAEDERVSRRLDKHASEGPVEEVRVGRLLRVEALLAEGGQGLHGHVATGRGVDELLELVDLGLVVVTGLVEIRAGGRGVGLVLVVRAAQAVATEAHGGDGSWWRAADG